MDGPYQFGSASTVLTVIRGRIFQQLALWCSLVLRMRAGGWNIRTGPAVCRVRDLMKIHTIDNVRGHRVGRAVLVQ
jgi:hypothetical protein